MKKIKLNSAFSYCLFMVLLFGVLSFLAKDLSGFQAPFFVACGVVFLMILPACSTQK